MSNKEIKHELIIDKSHITKGLIEEKIFHLYEYKEITYNNLNDIIYKIHQENLKETERIVKEVFDKFVELNNVEFPNSTNEENNLRGSLREEVAGFYQNELLKALQKGKVE